MPPELDSHSVADGGPGAAHRLAAVLGERRLRHASRGTLYRIGFAVAGFVVLVAGGAMLVLPGPGLLVTAIGLAMLALEFLWAERLLLRAVRLGGSGRDLLARRLALGRTRKVRADHERSRPGRLRRL